MSQPESQSDDNPADNETAEESKTDGIDPETAAKCGLWTDDDS
jgi:hypothetical protein